MAFALRRTACRSDAGLRARSRLNERPCGIVLTRPPAIIVCRSLMLHAPFGRLPAPTPPGPARVVTASDVRASLAVRQVSGVSRVTQRSNPRDGLCGRDSRLSPTGATPVATDPPNGSSHAPASAPRESWVKDFRAGFPSGTPREPTKRRAAPASSKATARTGCGVPCSQLSTGVATALQASSNTYLTGVHHGNKERRPGASTTL